MTTVMTTREVSREKRWTEREQRWVAPGAVFDPRVCSVDVILDDTPAERFVCGQHYSASYPAARFRVGLYGAGARLVGVAVFSEPMHGAVLRKWTGRTSADACELGRFVLLPEIGFNGESWFLARAFRLLAMEKGIRRVVSFADPIAWTVGADVVKAEHWGTIYQASNALFVGRSSARTDLVGPDGRPFSARALSKIRKQERGAAYAERQLLAAGAPPRTCGEHPALWLRRVRQSPGFTRRRHPGNLAYVFGLDAAARADLTALHDGGLPYPRRRAA